MSVFVLLDIAKSTNNRPTPARAGHAGRAHSIHRVLSCLYERYYSGDPVWLAGTLWGLYDKDTHIDRITRLLDDLASAEGC